MSLTLEGGAVVSSDNVGEKVKFETLAGGRVEFPGEGDIVGVATSVGGNVSLLGGPVEFPEEGAMVGVAVKFCEVSLKNIGGSFGESPVFVGAKVALSLPSEGINVGAIVVPGESVGVCVTFPPFEMLVERSAIMLHSSPNRSSTS